MVLLVVSAENGCEYCVAAHSAIAKNMVKADPAIVSAIRDDQPLPDAKLQALATFTQLVVRERGWVAPDSVAAFMTAGYTQANVLDVVLGVTMKTLSNYEDHIVHTPVDTAFQGEQWRKPEAA